MKTSSFKEYLIAAENEIVLEVEAGVVGGEDGAAGTEDTPEEHLHTLRTC